MRFENLKLKIALYFYSVKKELLFLFFIVSAKYSFSQNYHPFPDSIARWSECSFFVGAQTGGNTYDIHRGWFYALGNDTLINSINYTLVGVQSTWDYQLDNGVVTSKHNSPINPPGEIFGAIREDSSKKVWFRNFFHNMNELYLRCGGLYELAADTEILLYDFNLHLGDTIHFGSTFRTVLNIDSIMFSDGIYRKRYQVDWGGPCMNDYWIEGMGSSLGLFGAYEAAPCSQDSYQGCSMNCFWLNEENMISFPNYSSMVECDSSNYPWGVGIDLIDESDPEYHSINGKKIVFHLKDREFLENEIEIYNEIGQLVLNDKIENQNVEMDLSNLSEGIYFYRIADDYSKTLVGKFFIE